MKRRFKIMMLLVPVIIILPVIVFFSGWEYSESFTYSSDTSSRNAVVEDLTVMVRVYPKFTKGRSEGYIGFNSIKHYKGDNSELEIQVLLRDNIHIKMEDYRQTFQWPEEPVFISNLVVKNENGDVFELIGEDKTLINGRDIIRFKGVSGKSLNMSYTMHYIDPSSGKETQKVFNRQFTYEHRKKVSHLLYRWARSV